MAIVGRESEPPPLSRKEPRLGDDQQASRAHLSNIEVCEMLWHPSRAPLGTTAGSRNPVEDTPPAVGLPYSRETSIRRNPGHDDPMEGGARWRQEVQPRR